MLIVNMLDNILPDSATASCSQSVRDADRPDSTPERGGVPDENISYEGPSDQLAVVRGRV